jgi:hypothetical protein
MVKKILLAILVLILAVAGYFWYMFSRKGGGYDGPKQPPLALKHHSDAFNKSVDATMAAYFEMKSAFVEADTARAKEACRKMLQMADSINLKELKMDTAGIFMGDSLMLENIRANAKSLLQQTDITEMRKDFSMVNENLYPFLKGINYSGHIMYWQNCPMAFGEDKGANWISNTEEIINPYMGKFHPEYKAGMLHCGSVLDSIKAQ